MIPAFGEQHRPVSAVHSRPFAFSRPFARVLWPLGIRARSSAVRIDGERLVVLFGPWRVRTALANVDTVEVTGPFAAWKVCGPRLSLADRGLTFGTNAERGVCITFRWPVGGIEPTGLLRHPSLTVTVADPDTFAIRLRTVSALARPPRPDTL